MNIDNETDEEIKRHIERCRRFGEPVLLFSYDEEKIGNDYQGILIRLDRRKREEVV